jgi:hypothetical protein
MLDNKTPEGFNLPPWVSKRFNKTLREKEQAIDKENGLLLRRMMMILNVSILKLSITRGRTKLIWMNIQLQIIILNPGEPN